MTSKQVLPYEQAAEQRTITGWCCKACNRFWGDDEHMARYCCAATTPCRDCGQPVRKSSWCEPCHKKRRDETYAAMPQADWDSNVPLCMYDNDKFFFDTESIAEYIEEDPDRTLEGLQLVLCEKGIPRSFEANDYWNDDLGQDGELDGAKELDDYVNGWIAENFPTLWYPTNVRPTLELLKAMVG